MFSIFIYLSQFYHISIKIRQKIIFLLWLTLDSLLSFCHSSSLSLQGSNICHFYRAFSLTCQMLIRFSSFVHLHSHAMSSLKKKNKGAWIKQTVDIDLSSLQRRVIKGQIIISLMQFLIAPTINSLPWLSRYIQRFELLYSWFHAIQFNWITSWMWSRQLYLVLVLVSTVLVMS